MSADLLRTLIAHLPHYTQEGGHRTCVSRAQLQHALQDAGSDPETATALLDLIERLLSSTATLEPAALAQQHWQFISFPARLFALSLLQSLLDPDVQLLPATFWRSDRYEHPHTVDQQHDLLAALETRRVQQHLSEQPAPIRFVAIAAAWFKLGQHFLLHRREMNKIRDNHGEYVLIGGRVCYEDVAACEIAPAAVISQLNQPQQLPLAAFEIALIREIAEETGLEQEEDYTFKHWQALKPCCWLAGTAADYSYTEYTVHYFQIQLTLTGFLKLVQKEQNDPYHFTRFTQEELWTGKQIAGNKTNMHIFKHHLAYNKQYFLTQLKELPASFTLHYLFTKDSDRITLPFNHQTPLRKGINGKEKPCKQLELNLLQCQLLWLLGAAARGFPLQSCHPQLNVLEYGWLKITDPKINAELKAFANQLKAANLPLIEVFADHYFHLTVQPNCIFFDEANYRFTLTPVAETQKHRIQVHSAAVSTPLATVGALSSPCVEISKGLAADITHIQQHDLAYSEDKRLDDRFRKSVELPLGLTEMGLRRLLRIEKKYYRLAC